jgi:hypothetical protein
MTFEIYWDDKIENLLWLRLYDETTWAEYHDGVNAMVQALTEREETCDIIMLGETSMPSGSPIPHLRRTIKRLESMSQFGVCVSTVTDLGSAVDVVFLNIIGRLLRLNPSRFPTKRSKEEAFQFVMQVRDKRTTTV